MGSTLPVEDEQIQMSWRKVHTVKAKLKASSTTSHILCAFAMMAAAELQVNSPGETDIPDWLWVLFMVCTIVLVSVHVFALTIVTYILPNIEAVTSMEDSSLLTSSLHDHFANFIELAHFFSKVLGLILFLIEFEILCWVKFWDFSFAAAISGSIVLTITLGICITFAVQFHHTLIRLKLNSTDEVIRQLEFVQSHLHNSEIFNVEQKYSQV